MYAAFLRPALLFCLLLSCFCPASKTAAHPLRYLDLAGPAGESRAELSGLAWHGEQLILLPQFPERFADLKGLETGAVGRIFALDKAAIVAALRNETSAPLYPRSIPVYGPELRTLVPGYEGFEAVVCERGAVWLAIEARAFGLMRGYLIRAQFVPGKGLVLAPNSLTRVLPPANIRNMGFEALLLTPDNVVALFEINSPSAVTRPVARVFSRRLRPLRSLPVPAVEYRITDAAALDENNNFWASNFYWRGEYKLLRPGPDRIATRFGQQPIDPAHMNLERLLQLHYTKKGIDPTDRAPLILGSGLIPRNWEGLARIRQPKTAQYDEIRGFLLATDKFPVTLLAFVPLKDE